MAHKLIKNLTLVKRLMNVGECDSLKKLKEDSEKSKEDITVNVFLEIMDCEVGQGLTGKDRADYEQYKNRLDILSGPELSKVKCIWDRGADMAPVYKKMRTVVENFQRLCRGDTGLYIYFLPLH